MDHCIVGGRDGSLTDLLADQEEIIAGRMEGGRGNSLGALGLHHMTVT